MEPRYLCRTHLLGEHRELHAIWSILTKDKKGYRNHPETKRWIGKLGALYRRHSEEVLEMEKRGYNHNSDLNPNLAIGKKTQDIFVHTVLQQKEILRDKKCLCFS